MNRRLAAIALVALVGIIGFWLVWGAAAPPPATPSGPPESITIGLEPNQVNSLVYIADEKGYFAQNGLAVTLKNYSSGAAAVDGMLADEADLAMATEWVLAGQALAQRPVRTIASIDRFEQMYLLGRNDRGIRNTSDLKGTTIGLQRKTSAEFYLGRYLDLHGTAVRDVTLVDIAAPKLADALANGTVDAVVVWQPYAAGITDRMPTGLAVWPAESGQPAYCTAITTDAWFAGHPETARRFLAALARAETDVTENPAAAKALVGKRLNYTSTYLDAVWPAHRFSLSLDQSLVAAMEDQARWKIANNLTNATAVPDFGEYIDTAALKQVRPDAVRIIG